MGDPGWRGESGHSSWPARIPQITYDRVEIIAINRATGYMGSVQTVMQAAGTGDGLGRDLSWAIDEIKLLPPNLKIWVERDYKIQEGLKKGELVKDQIIGYEGAALSSDIGIAIHTEWLKPDGTPFPVSPDTSGADFGYTGRLAYLSGNEQVASNEAVGIAHFPIKPGRQLQVFQLPGSHLPNQYFYLQVGPLAAYLSLFKSYQRESGL
ncbi:MAG: hypothetical protein H7A00_09705 [Hahellaceae bacterium]|nr:hypothetical protein [Hahellaceae bacterium]